MADNTYLYTYITILNNHYIYYKTVVSCLFQWRDAVFEHSKISRKYYRNIHALPWIKLIEYKKKMSFKSRLWSRNIFNDTAQAVQGWQIRYCLVQDYQYLAVSRYFGKCCYVEYQTINIIYVLYQLLTLDYKVLNGNGPEYLRDLLELYKPN